MARSRALEATLEQLSRARDDPSAPASLALLRKVLSGRSAHAAARAAEIAGETELGSLTPDLVAAFERFLVRPVQSDPSCAAKTAIADALYRIGAAEVELYLKGIRHVQPEPVWGGKVDTATKLRGTCALALVRVHYRDFLCELADLLADREAPARRLAAQALAYSESADAVPLLRLKALTGDADPQVLSECLLGLLRIAPGPSLDFVARFLDRPEAEVAEAAALTLGGSRLREAFPILAEWWERTSDPSLRRCAMLAIAMSKRDEALDYLLAHVAGSPAIHARDAVRALAVYRHDPKLRARVEAALRRREDTELAEPFARSFASDAEPDEE